MTLSSYTRHLGRLFYCLISALVLLALPARCAEPTKTLIQDTIYRADGSVAKGTLLISWPAFSSVDGKPVASGSLSVKIAANGSVNIPLIPTQGAVPSGTAYKVVLALDDGSTSTEYWAVPTLSPTTIAAIRSTQVPATVAMQVVSREYVDAQLATAVRKNGDETITGAKTFISSPLVPSPGTAAAAANKDYVDVAIATAATSGANVLNINKGGTGTNAFTPARCVRVADDGNSLESATNDCGGANADTVDGSHAIEFLHKVDDEAATGKKTFQNVNGTRYASMHAGTSAGDRISACLAALPATGGTCIADFEGAQILASGGIAVGSATKPVTLIIPKGASFTVTATDGLDVFKVGDSSAIRCDSPGTAMLSASACRIALASTANVRSIIANADNANQEGMFLDGLNLVGNASATVSDAIVSLTNVHVPTALQNLTIDAFPSIGLHLSQVSQIIVFNTWVNGESLPGARPLVIEHGSSGISFYGGALEHAGAGNWIAEAITVSGDPGATGSLYFYGTYLEGSATTAGGLRLTDVFNVGSFGLQIGGSFAASADGIRIVHGTATTPVGIDLRAVQGPIVAYGAPTGLATLVNDTVNSRTFLGKQYSTNGYLDAYSLAAQEAHTARAISASDTITGKQTFQSDADGSPVITIKSAGATPADDFLDAVNNVGTKYFYVDAGGNAHARGSGYFYGQSDTASMSLRSDGLKVYSGASAATLWGGKLNINGSFGSDSAPANGLYVLGQIKSGVATGTKPIDTVSTTLNDNLNADLLDGKHAGELVATTEKGAANGLATLDSGSKLSSAQLPDLSGTYVPKGTASWPTSGTVPSTAQVPASGSCTNQVVTALNNGSAPGCASVTAAMLASSTYRMPIHGYCTGTAGTSQVISVVGLGATAVLCSQATAPSIAGVLMTAVGTIKNFYVAEGASQKNGTSMTWTVYKNNVATALTCTVANGQTTCNDVTHSFTVAAGDYLSVKSGTTASSSETLANVSVALEMWN